MNDFELVDIVNKDDIGFVNFIEEDYYVNSSKHAENIVEYYKNHEQLELLHSLSKAIIDKYPNRVYGWILLILTKELYVSTADAIAYCKKALESKGTRKPNLWLLYIELSRKVLSYDDMLKVFNDVLSKIINDKILLTFIDFLFENERNDLTEKWCVKFINDKYSTSHIPYYKLIEVYIKQERLDEAKLICEELISKNVNNSEAWRYLVKIERLILSNDVEVNISDKIVRSIDFSPEHYSAGMSILQNFCRLLKNKYSNESVGVTIKQEDYKVTMIIDPPNGEIEEVEEYLTSYGLVVQGVKEPEEIVANKFELMELKTELMLARTRLELSKEHHVFVCGNYESRITSLESDLSFLKNQISISLNNHNLQLKSVIDIIKDKDELINSLTDKLFVAISNNDEAEAKKIISEIYKVKPDSISSLKTFLVNTSSGITGNIPAWVDFFTKLLP
ncbi:tetratricopeptide repeat protein [Vibrio parahaemolyticus]|nr:tetratricopeptide repeat protein [Vibrio parahaemolyticus]